MNSSPGHDARLALLGQINELPVGKGSPDATSDQPRLNQGKSVGGRHYVRERKDAGSKKAGTAQQRKLEEILNDGDQLEKLIQELVPDNDLSTLQARLVSGFRVLQDRYPEAGLEKQLCYFAAALKGAKYGGGTVIQYTDMVRAALSDKPGKLLRDTKKRIETMTTTEPDEPLSLTDFQEYDRVIIDKEGRDHEVLSALMIMFIFLLRSKECLSLTWDDVEFGKLADDSTRMMVELNIRKSKTDQAGHGFGLSMCCRCPVPGSGGICKDQGGTVVDICPVCILARRFKLHGNARYKRVFNLGRQDLTSFIDRMCRARGILNRIPGRKRRLWNTHSCRVGGTQAACLAGIPPDTLKVIGRWKTDCFERYRRAVQANPAGVRPYSPPLTSGYEYARYAGLAGWTLEDVTDDEAADENELEELERLLEA